MILSGPLALCTRLLLHLWYTWWLQRYFRISADNRTLTCAGSLNCTNWKAVVRLQSTVVLLLMRRGGCWAWSWIEDCSVHLFWSDFPLSNPSSGRSQWSASSLITHLWYCSSLGSSPASWQTAPHLSCFSTSLNKSPSPSIKFLFFSFNWSLAIQGLISGKHLTILVWMVLSRQTFISPGHTLSYIIDVLSMWLAQIILVRNFKTTLQGFFNVLWTLSLSSVCYRVPLYEGFILYIITLFVAQNIWTNWPVYLFTKTTLLPETVN